MINKEINTGNKKIIEFEFSIGNALINIVLVLSLFFIVTASIKENRVETTKQLIELRQEIDSIKK